MNKKAKGIQQSGRMKWANDAHFLGDILSSSDPWIDQEALAQLMDFDRCPASSIYLNSIWRYAKNLPEGGPHKNDSDDWGQVPAIAYADYSLIETKLRNHLVAGTRTLESRVFSDPVQFADHLGF